MNVVSGSLKSGSALADDYIKRFSQVQHLYGADFNQTSSWEKRAEWLDETEQNRVSRDELFECLTQYNGKHNSHEAVHTSLELLKKPGTLAVVGGQQSGLFTGSLLVIYKAVTIIQSAKEAQEKLGRPVVPVFWIAGEDHDWDEVNHTYLMTPELKVSKIKMDAQPGPRSSVSQISVKSEQWRQALEKLGSILPDSEHKSDILHLLRQSTEESNNLSDAFAKLMGHLFGEHGLILLDSADPELRKLEMPLFETIIDRNDDLEKAYQASASRITSQGYSLQAEVAEDGANLFYIHEGNRFLLFKQNGYFADRKGVISFTKEEIKDCIRTHPERFSNNVLTRPLMQDTILPVLSSVLGQGEISYWALTKDAFEVLGMSMPILLPRMSFTLVEGTLQKYMDQFGISFQDVQYRLEDLRQTWLSQQDTQQIQPKFEQTKQAFEALYDPLIHELAQTQPGLTKLGETNKNKIMEQIAFLQRKSKEALEKRNDAGLRQWDRIGVSLFPLGKPQERVYNIFYYLNRFGISWINDLINISEHYSAEHRIIQL
ncbi:bacillithiol biosynthesis cysteine-adding enzyme BshC [Paenibacillus pini]|uniref:Putative cysteine ligase BshC n=1 Tax=Paenibacillus pini JCM 16418 TaxID=1236976 RepID=W7YR76_9BACL|nr:bacillithiol biosynthesis cysteine-adding enzyme BshC [Paenibacillus pini]GAF07076.1 hypothetical protein JCM16418_1065 [Paenibacillus pini JCM 16418]